jgi:creatinine amidohydrolase/Fe(II)-dependent formamide hydrolase-like protein
MSVSYVLVMYLNRDSETVVRPWSHNYPQDRSSCLKLTLGYVSKSEGSANHPPKQDLQKETIKLANGESAVINAAKSGNAGDVAAAHAKYCESMRAKGQEKWIKSIEAILGK